MSYTQLGEGINYVPHIGVVEPNGATDGTVITNALAAGSVKLAQGKTFTLDTAIVIPSNCTLDISGATLQRAAGYPGGNMIRNSAAVAIATAADGEMTASSPTLATSLASQARVGQMVSVTGVGTSGATIYTSITAVGSGDVTLAVNAVTTASAQTVNLFNRDSNIALIADPSTVVSCGANAGTDNNLMNILFRRVDGLVVQGRMGLISSTNNCGNLRIGDATMVRCSGWRFDCPSSDGLHLTGPLKDFEVEGFFGTTGDDFVALTPVDESPYADVYGSMTDGYVGGLYADSCVSVIDQIGGTLPEGGTATVARITVERLRGTVANGSAAGQGVRVWEDNTGPIALDNYMIRDVKVQTGTGTSGTPMPAVSVQSSQCGRVDIESVGWLGGSGSGTSQSVIVNIQVTGSRVEIHGVHVPTGVDYVDVVRAGDGASAYTLDSLVVNGLDFVGSPSNTVNVVRVTASTTVTDLTVEDFAVLFGSLDNNAHLVSIDASGTVTNATRLCRGISNQLGAVVNVSGTCGAVGLESVQAPAGSNGVVVTGAISTTVQITGSSLSSLAGAAVENIGTGTVRVLMDPSTVAMASSVGNSSTGHVSLNGQNASCDLALLTPQDGDMVYNANSGLSCGVGLCIFHTGGTGNGWKNVYSGATY